MLSKKTLSIILVLIGASPNFIYGQKEKEDNNRSAVQLNFECSISNCDFIISGSFEGDLETLRNDDGDLFSELGPNIQGASVSIPIKGHPVSYVSGETLKVKLNFIGECAALTAQSEIRGISTSGYEFPALSPGYDNNSGNYYYEGEALNSFEGGKVDLVDLEVNWQMKSEGSQVWEDVGMTKNKVYVTLKEPIAEGVTNTGEVNPSYKHYESCFHLGCTEAKDSETEESVIENVWAAFATADVKNLVGEPLKYYDSENWGPTGDYKHVPDLLREENGQCTAWCRFFIEVLKAMGLVEQELRFFNVELNGPVSGAVQDDGFFIKDWVYFPASGIFNDHEEAAICIDNGYTYVMVPDQTGFPPPITTSNTYDFPYHEMEEVVGGDDDISGQNSPNPESIFNWHQVCKIGDTYYDPSYGGAPYNATDFLLNYQNNNISGYFKWLKLTNVIEADLGTGGVDIDGLNGISNMPKSYFVYFVKKHDENITTPLLELPSSSGW